MLATTAHLTSQEVGMAFDYVIAIVSDSTAYCKKAYRDVLSAVYPNSLHMLCITHMVNLTAQVFHHHANFQHTSDLNTMIKLSLFKKPGREVVCWSSWMTSLPMLTWNMPPVPVSSCWNLWFKAVIYHPTRIHLYKGFTRWRRGKEWLLSVSSSWWCTR